MKQIRHRKYSAFTTVFVAIMAASVFFAQYQNSAEGISTPPSGKIWNLTFADEFSGSSLNTNNWDYQTGAWSGSNVQNCYKSDSNTISVSGGALNITARYTPGVTCGGTAHDFTSGFIQGLNKKSWTYGYFEARVKMPTNNDSMWPAFWMSPQSAIYGSWPRSGEIDIFEQQGYDPNTVYSSAHWGISTSNKRQNRGTASVANVGEWHTYGLEWLEGSLKYYIDGNLYHSITSFPAPNATTDPGPFNIPFYIRLNMAVGGDYLGAPNNDAHNNIDQFPATMQVDYVRVYQLTNAPVTDQPATGGTDDGSDPQPPSTSVPTTSSGTSSSPKTSSPQPTKSSSTSSPQKAATSDSKDGQSTSQSDRTPPNGDNAAPETAQKEAKQPNHSSVSVSPITIATMTGAGILVLTGAGIGTHLYYRRR